ncbi:MAG: phosphoenolpyruvate--protein phosphotransferase [Motilibacteraceae bacterium]
MTVGLVVVSHSRPLARAAIGLAEEMLQGQDVPIVAAAGLDDGSPDGAVGTDATAIYDALSEADRGDGVVVLMDLGSAVLSAELALELLDDEARERVLLCPAPLVEGLVAAAATAAGGADREQVAAEATAGLLGKQEHLGMAPGPEGPVAAAEPGGAEATASFIVTPEHGLHARPAARLVQAVGGWDARVEVRNASTGSGWVPAASLSRVSTLGAQHGHEVQVRASGRQAQQAVDALTALAARDFDETAHHQGTTEPATAEVEPPPGGPAPGAPGVAVGPVRVLRPPRREDLLAALPPPGTGPEESARLERARAEVREALRRTAQATARAAGPDAAGVFEAHLLLLDDPDVVADAARRIQEGTDAAHAWLAATEALRAQLAALPDPYQRERAADVVAVADQVLAALAGSAAAAGPDLGGARGGTVLVAPDLTPAQAVGLDPARVAGVVLAHGSPTAHATILARARAVPLVLGAGSAVLDLPDGTVVALDGATGELHVDPDPATRQAMERRRAAQQTAAQEALARAGEPARTRDGVHVLVAANVGSLPDALGAAARGADAAGLVRTEFLFLDRESAPDVEEQEAVYRELATALDGRRITLRTLDVGGDKPLPYLPTAPEENPFLGVRGIRLSLARPALLADQLLAVVRTAHHHPVSVMVPMVATVAELLTARRLLEDAARRDGRPLPADLQVGVMVEIPAAALKTAALAPHVDFLSIGTNDLTQYALAVDRGNQALTALGDPYDPGVLGLVDAVCRGAGDRLVAVCGELAGDPRATALLVGLGVRELSLTPAQVPLVKDAVRATDAGAAARLARRALVADGPDAVRALLAEDSENASSSTDNSADNSADAAPASA